jgi:iron complex transport system substrate-binding protein
VRTHDCPDKIISLGPLATERLYLLGAGDNVIGNTVYCEKPVAAKAVQKIGTVTQVNIEEIVALKPDLVIATGLTRDLQISKLKQFGFRIEIFKTQGDFEDFCNEFIKIGSYVCMEDKAKEIISDVKKKVDKAISHTSSLPVKSVFFQLGMDPLFTVISNTFLHDMIIFAGGSNIASQEGTGIYSREKVLEADPDVIILTGMGMKGESVKKTWYNYKTLKAVQHDAVFIVDSFAFCSPTPVTFVTSLYEMIGLLHPDNPVK